MREQRVLDALMLAPAPLENHSEQAESEWHGLYWRWYHWFRTRALDGKEVYARECGICLQRDMADGPR